jgi:hypothetical protein
MTAAEIFPDAVRLRPKNLAKIILRNRTLTATE